MSTPRTKRPFAGAAADPTQRQITFFGASAPSSTAASVQANLLSVGMRVRKSVPEGYRTTGPSAFKLWTDSTPAAPRLARGAGPRELLPFCGINKVGGLGTQPETDALDEDEDGVLAMDDVPGLTLSQESVESNVSEPSRKRIFDDDDDDDGPDTFARLNSSKAWDANCGNARLVATPRRSRAAKGLPLEDMGQENVVVDDFEEATFLDFRESRNMDLSA